MCGANATLCRERMSLPCSDLMAQGVQYGRAFPEQLTLARRSPMYAFLMAQLTETIVIVIADVIGAVIVAVYHLDVARHLFPRFRFGRHPRGWYSV